MKFISDALMTDGENHRRKVLSVTSQGCDIGVTWQHQLVHNGPVLGSTTWTYTATLPMKSIRDMDVNDRLVVGEIVFALRTRLAVHERREAITIFEGRTSKDARDSETSLGELRLPIRDGKSYDRIERAFRHAMKLCGKERDLF